MFQAKGTQCNQKRCKASVEIIIRSIKGANYKKHSIVDKGCRPSFSLNKYDPSSSSIPLSVQCRTPASVNEIFIRISITTPKGGRWS